MIFPEVPPVVDFRKMPWAVARGLACLLKAGVVPPSAARLKTPTGRRGSSMWI